MVRRIHTPVLREGDIVLSESQARHARVVLRLADGAEVEVFDDAGHTAAGTLICPGPKGALVRVAVFDPARAGEQAPTGPRWSVAAAVPKGERADWMVEKLSELGAEAFIPLATARGVVLPAGRGKHDRWVRIATESARQSRRRGVMRVEPLTPLARAVEAAAVPKSDSASAPACGRAKGWCLSTEPDVTPIARAAEQAAAEQTDGPLTLFVGPEGGWAPEEVALMTAAGLTPVGLTRTVLRVETAAVAAGAVVAVLLGSRGTDAHAV